MSQYVADYQKTINIPYQAISMIIEHLGNADQFMVLAIKLGAIPLNTANETLNIVVNPLVKATCTMGNLFDEAFLQCDKTKKVVWLMSNLMVMYYDDVQNELKQASSGIEKQDNEDRNTISQTV